MIYSVPDLQQQLWESYLATQNGEAQEAIALGEAKVFGFAQFALELFHRFYDASAQLTTQGVKPELLWLKLLHEEIDFNPDYSEVCNTIALESTLDPSKKVEYAGHAALYFAIILQDLLPEPVQPPVNPQSLREQVRVKQAHLAEIDNCLARFENSGSLTPEETAQRDDLLAIRPKILGEITELTRQGEALVESINAYREAIAETLELYVQACLDGSIAQIRQEIEKYAQLDNLLGGGNGWGLGRGTFKVSGSTMQQSILLQRIQKSHRLRRLADVAGKMHLRAQRAQSTQRNPLALEDPDLTIGDDLLHVLPTELVRATDPDLAASFLLDYSDRALIQQVSQQAPTKGSLVICLDSSGTMTHDDGDREIWAKALTLALINIAQVQNREVIVIHFDDGPRQIDDFSGQYDPHKILDCMETYYGGGTEWMSTLDTAVRLVTGSHADIVLITDGRAAVSEEWLQKFKQAQHVMGFKVYGILVDLIEDYLDPICDLVIKVADIVNDAEVDQVFAI